MGLPYGTPHMGPILLYILLNTVLLLLDITCTDIRY